MKSIPFLVFMFALAGCSTQIHRFPSDGGALKVYIQKDRLFIENTQYGGFYALSLSNIDSIARPTRANVASFEDFTKERLLTGDADGIPVLSRWCVLSKIGGRYEVRDYSGDPLPASPAVYLLNTDSFAPDYFGYVVIRSGLSPLVFYVKPKVVKQRVGPGFLWGAI